MPTSKSERVLLPHLKAWRLSQYLSQDELAEKAGVAKTTIVRIEGGQPAILSTIGKLANVLGITRKQLVEEAPDAKRVGAA